MGRRDGLRLAHVGRGQLADRRDSQQSHRYDELVLQDLQDPYKALPSRGSQAPCLEPPDAHGASPEGEGLRHVASSLDPTVQDNVGLAVNSLDDIREHVHGPETVVELAPTVVRHPYDVDAVLDRQKRVLGRRHALEYERKAGELLDPCHLLPGEGRQVGRDRGLRWVGGVQRVSIGRSLRL